MNRDDEANVVRSDGNDFADDAAGDAVTSGDDKANEK